jgi:hypothetical protein
LSRLHENRQQAEIINLSLFGEERAMEIIRRGDMSPFPEPQLGLGDKLKASKILEKECV